MAGKVNLEFQKALNTLHRARLCLNLLQYKKQPCNQKLNLTLKCPSACILVHALLILGLWGFYEARLTFQK